MGIYDPQNPAIPKGIYIEMKDRRLLSLQDAVTFRLDWTVFPGQRVAVVREGLRLMIDSREAGYTKDWETAMEMAERAGGRLMTRHEAIELSKAKPEGLDTALSVMLANPMAGPYWTQDEDDDPRDKPVMAYIANLWVFRIECARKKASSSVRFVFPF